MSATASTTNQSRKVSMTMADLEAIHEERTMTTATTVPKQEDENVEIFQEICMDIEQEYNVEKALTPPVSRQRRGSLCQDEDDLMDGDYYETTAAPFRRHSGYESRARRESRKAHSEAKEYLEQQDNTVHSERRASFVNNMLEFNLSLSIADGADKSSRSMMQASCPVLSYMNDDEEDSVELRMMKRPSMTYVGDDSLDQSWESLKEDTESSMQQQSREYVIELPPMEELEEDTKPRSGGRRRRRKPHSYKLLEQQLEQHSPIEVLKQFNTSFNNVDVQQQRPAALPPAQPKSLNADNDLRMAMTMSAPPMAASRPATARGA